MPSGVSFVGIEMAFLALEGDANIWLMVFISSAVLAIVLPTDKHRSLLIINDLLKRDGYSKSSHPDYFRLLWYRSIKLCVNFSSNLKEFHKILTTDLSLLCYIYFLFYCGTYLIFLLYLTGCGFKPHIQLNQAAGGEQSTPQQIQPRG